MTIAAYKTIGNVRKAVIGLLLVGASCVSSQASAALVLFNLTGGATVSFTLDQSPTPFSVSSGGFGVDSFTKTVQGALVHVLAGFGTNGGFFLKFGTTTVDVMSYSHTPLFSGTTATPTFILGNYFLRGDITTLDHPKSFGGVNLSITSVPGGVPEPSTWMMMVAGFGLLGGAMRYGNNARAGAKTASLT